MRRLTVLAALLGVAIAACLALGPGPLLTGAQGGTPTGAAPGFVGSWRITVSEAGGSSQSLSTLMADGTVLNSDVPILPAGGGQPATISSAGHGLWQQTGPTTADITFVELVSDLQGHYLASVTVSGQLTLGADGTSFRGPFSGMVVDPSGKVLATFNGTAQGTRITIQPMASPSAGTPAA